MQCHVRTVCSAINTPSPWRGSIAHLWLFLLVRQWIRLRARTEKTAGLLWNRSQEQWECREVTGCCYDTDAVKMLVCRSRQHSNAARLCKAVHSSSCSTVQWEVSSMALEFKSKAVTHTHTPTTGYLLVNSCLNTTQAPIKIPKTKNYNSRLSVAFHAQNIK